MGKNLCDLRFAVQREDGYTSSPWRLWITASGDVYLATKAMAGIEKYSFHRSGICRSAFTKEHGTPARMSDRAMTKWKRAPTPPSGSGQASRVAWLAFPTDYLSRMNLQEKKAMIWLRAPERGGATFVEFAYSAESAATIEAALAINQRKLLSFTPISPSESFFVFSYYGDWENSDLKSPTAADSIFPDLLFSEHDPNDTGRPVRICIASLPVDGDAVLIRELGGCRAAQ